MKKYESYPGGMPHKADTSLLKMLPRVSLPKLSDRIERSGTVRLHSGEYLLEDERQMIVNALQQLEEKLDKIT